MKQWFSLQCCGWRRQNKIRIFLILISLSLLTLVALWFQEDIEEVVYQNHCALPKKAIPIAHDPTTCNIPKINPFDPQAMKLVKDVGPLRCKIKEKATLSGGVLTITDPTVVKASYQEINRPPGDDFGSSLREMKTLRVSGETKQFTVTSEYIKLKLHTADGDIYTEYLLQAIAKEEIMKRGKHDTYLNLSVLIMGLETVSHAHAQRKLPKSYQFIKESLGGFIFNGHSVVGDGTTEQVAAMLTGKSERDYGDARRKVPGTKPVDNWNWIFKDAKEKGYVTSFSEDAPSVGTFQYRLTGFHDPPTDYYPRAFYIEAYKQYAARKERDDCIGSQKIHTYHLDLARRIYEQYPNRHKFLYHFESELSHNLFNNIQKMDEDLLQFMTEFQQKGYFDNTVFILMGDHGWRYGDFRQSIQGKLEERLPLFTMSFPQSFKQKHPDLVKNLEGNTNRLTSWFDVYATFKHMLHFPQEPRDLKRGLSLLTKVPRQRTCGHAGIPTHWCPCVLWVEASVAHNHVRNAASAVIEYINHLNSNDPLAAAKCSKLDLNKITFVEVQTPSTAVLRFGKTSDADGYVPEYGRPVWSKNVCHYRLALTASPSNAHYEASVNYVHGKFIVESGLNRVNAYGDQPNCIANVLPNLRKYCYCIK